MSLRFTKSELKGHTASINCVRSFQRKDGEGDALSHSLLSASDDGSVRVWDQRTSKPVQAIIDSKKTGYNACDISSKNPFFITACCGNEVHAYDLRKGGVLVKDALWSFTRAEEEVNDVRISKKGVVAAASDDGAIYMLDSSSGDLKRELRPRRNEQSSPMVTSLYFLPRQPSRLLAGDMASRGRMWDFELGRVVNDFHMYEHQPDDDKVEGGGEGGPTMVNPPFVMAVDACDKYAAFGCGDLSFRLLSFRKKGEVVVKAVDGHRSFVNAVHFAQPAGGSPKKETDVHVLLTGGNDARVFIWHVLETKEGVFAKADGRVEHGSKVNGLCDAAGGVFGFAVCDEGPSISLYKVK